MSRVRVMFFHIRTRPADQDPKLRPGLFTKWIFFGGPEPTPTGAHGSCYALPDLGTICGPNRGPTKIELKPPKKKKRTEQTLATEQNS